MKYIHFLSLGTMAFEQGAYGTHTTTTTANQIAHRPLAKIDIDTYDWNAEENIRYENDSKQKLENWRQKIENIQLKILQFSDEDSDGEKAQCGCKCIAKAYVKSFFPELKDEELENKITEIEQIFANESNEQIDHQTFTTGMYGNEGFFNQTAAPLRQLIVDVLRKAIEQDKLDLSDDEAVRAFYEKIVVFCAIARGSIAAVAGSDDMNLFGMPAMINHAIIEP
ncbi:MAG: hypothetical protein LBJ71_04965, partial [Holosporaceae bacterium]|nr:hypothetical protein [Holosporaceae bacterium]